MPSYYFLDSSALVKHYHVEAGTEVVDTQDSNCIVEFILHEFVWHRIPFISQFSVIGLKHSERVAVLVAVDWQGMRQHMRLSGPRIGDQACGGFNTSHGTLNGAVCISRALRKAALTIVLAVSKSKRVITSSSYSCLCLLPERCTNGVRLCIKAWR